MQEYEFLCKNMLLVILLRRFTCVGGDLDKQRGFDQSKISNYDRQYIEELKS